MIKKIGAFVILFTLVMNITVFAEEETTGYTYEALKIEAIEDHLELDASALNLEIKEMNLEEILEIAASTYDGPMDRVNYIKNMIKIYSDPLTAELAVYVAKANMENQIESIQNEIWMNSMKYLLLEKEILLNENLLAYENYYLNVVEKKVAAGLVSQDTFANQLLVVENQEIKVNLLKIERNSLQVEINQMIGAPFDLPIVIDESLEILPFESYDMDTVYNDTFEKNIEIYENQILVQSKEIVFDLYADQYLETNKEYKIALYDLQIAEIQLSDAKLKYEAALKTSYNDYLNAYEAYELAVEQLGLEKDIYELLLKEYQAGLIAEEILKKAETSVQKSEYNVSANLVAFNLERISFLSLFQ
ncbi:MAG: TolC family protein [Clostridia bacterium]|nr:TolC family protein [Clostridia bacterium]